MRSRPLAALAVSLALLGPAADLAWSQADPSLDQIYQAANAGDLRQADTMIDQVLRNHPNSAKAHYVKAELAARESNAAVARQELATAERLAPGLPFARPEAVQALRAEVNGGGQRPARAAQGSDASRAAGAAVSPAHPASPAHGFSWGLAAVIAAVVIGAMALLRRRRTPPAGGDGTSSMGTGMGSPGPYGPTGPGGPVPGQGYPGGYAGGPAGYGGYGAPGGMGSSLGRGLATGLAVGAGAVAAQEIGRRMFHPDGTPVDPVGTPADVEPGLLDPSVNADMGGRDFGVNDAGGWDDAAGGGGFDTGGMDAGGGGSDWDT